MVEFPEMKNFWKAWQKKRVAAIERSCSPYPLHRRLTSKEQQQLLYELRHNDFAEFVRYMRSPWWIAANNFLAGIFRGLGLIVGMTIIFAILIWSLSQFVNFPLIGHYFQAILGMLEQFSPQSFSSMSNRSV